MNRIIAYIILLCLSPVFSVKGQTLVEKAATAYSADKFNEAIDLYHQIIKDEGISDDLYYNLGNSYYRIGDLGHAVLYYERALLLNPGNKEARANLAFVNSKLEDKVETDENIVDAFFSKLAATCSSNGWAIIGIIAFFLFLAAVAVYIFSRNIWLRKVGFFGGFFFLLLCVVINVIAFRFARKIEDSRQAVVVKDASLLSTSPREPKNKQEEAFILHNGTKVQLMDSVETKTDSALEIWYDVKVDEAHRAWIRKTDVERI